MSLGFIVCMIKALIRYHGIISLGRCKNIMQIYLAPMEGITTYIYRNALAKYYGGVDKFFTPFLANQNLNHKELNDVLPEHNTGLQVVPQILANKADTFLEITKRLVEFGYGQVNLNLGCPSGTVVARKRGAGFLSVPDQLDCFLEEIFSKSPLPISIKTRIGVEQMEEWERILSVYRKYPLAELIIHPRLQKEFYRGKAHPEAYLMACEKGFGRLCYNGDITDLVAMDALFEGLGDCIPSAIMVGRGAIANPALPKELAEHANPGLPKELFRDFHNEILNGYREMMSGDQPVLFKMKELWVYMGPYRGLTDKQMKKIRKAGSLAEYESIVDSF